MIVEDSAAATDEEIADEAATEATLDESDPGDVETESEAAAEADPDTNPVADTKKDED